MFERFVPGARGRSRRRAVLIASLALHAGVAVALVVGSVFHVAEIAPPLVAVVFAAAPEPPPPPPPPPSVRKRTTPPHQASTPAPRPVPQVAPAVAPTPEPPATPDPPGSPDGPIGDGRPDGRTGGHPDSTGTTPPPSAPPPRPRNVAPHALDAQKIAGALPHLPALVKAQRPGDSRFLAKLCVDRAGAVSSVGVLSGIPGADESIVATLREWRYRPQPIPVCFVTEFVFSVH
jgi:periplasmic protein TonB